MELSSRQVEILTLLAVEGLQMRGIAARLGISEQTVKQHLLMARIKLNVDTNVQAVYRYFVEKVGQ